MKTKSMLFALAAVACYAVQNVIIKQKLGSVSAVTMMVCYTATLLPLSCTLFIILRRAGDTTAVIPGPHVLKFVLLCAVITFVAEYCFFSAYAHDGDPVTITMTMTLLPVFVVVIRYIFGLGTPTTSQLLAIPFGILAVYLATRTPLSS